MKEFKNRDWLDQKYTIEKLSMNNIAKLCSVDLTLIEYWMKKLCVKTRTKSNARKLYLSKNPQAMKGKNHPRWTGGGRREGYDYIYVYQPNHPDATHAGYVLEHRLVMEKKLGRRLIKDEIVHHINGVRNDNRSENLLLETKRSHPIGYAGGYQAGYNIAMSKMTERLMKNRDN